MSSRQVTREEAQALIGPEGTLPQSAGSLYLGEGQYAEYPAAGAETVMRFNVEEHMQSLERLQTRIVEEQIGKNAAYSERNQLVALVAALAKSELPGWHAWLGKHEEDPTWDPEWMNIVFIDTPKGQLSWHVHDGEMELFTGLQIAMYKKWDGHTTEEKYQRIARLVSKLLGR